jgi:hypothetical protein
LTLKRRMIQLVGVFWITCCRDLVLDQSDAVGFVLVFVMVN